MPAFFMGGRIGKCRQPEMNASAVYPVVFVMVLATDFILDALNNVLQEIGFF